MARHYINAAGESKKYSAREQKKRTMNALGLVYNNPADNRLYKSIYDDVSRRTRQYNILQDLPKKSQLSPADVLFDIAYDRLRQGIIEPPSLSSIQTTIRQRGEGYSATIQNLYNMPLSSNTATFKRRVQQNPSLFIESAINNELRVFNNFLYTKGVDNDLETFNIWLNENVTVYIDKKYINKETGELLSNYKILSEEEAKDERGLIDLDKYYTDTAPRRTVIRNIKDVREKLKELAADRKSRYKRIYSDRENNIYNYELTQA